MVFCRGCGKEIHETATMCPHCGYQNKEIASHNEGKSVWMAVVSSILALVLFLNWFSVDNWDHDTRVGAWFFSIVSISLSSISLSMKQRGKVFNYISIGVSSITMLILIGQM